MKEEKGHEFNQQDCRLAGFLYLVNAVTGFFGIIYVPGRLIVSGKAAKTATNILASERLYRASIVSQLRKFGRPSGGHPADAWRTGDDLAAFA